MEEEIQSVTSTEWKLVHRRLDDLENLVTDLKLKLETLGECKCNRSNFDLETQLSDDEETETMIGLDAQSILTSAASGILGIPDQSATHSEEILILVGQDAANTADLTSTASTGSNIGDSISANTTTNGLPVSTKSTMRLSNEIGIQEIEKYRRAQVKLRRCDQVEITGTSSTSEFRIANTKSTVTSIDKKSHISSKKRPVLRRTGKGARAEKLSAPSLSRQKPFVCRICTKRFGHKCHLTEHIRVHTGEKPFHCNICSKKYSQRSNFKRHTRVHTGEKPYQCSFCSMKFSGGHNLASHVRRHIGERPYTCQFCSQEFYTHSDLARHLKVHTREKPHSCPFCPKEFSQRGHLKIHLNKHPGKTPQQSQVQIDLEKVP